MYIFQRKVRKYEIQEKSRTELNPRHVPEIEDCPGKSRTDGHPTLTPEQKVVETSNLVEVFSLSLSHVSCGGGGGGGCCCDYDIFSPCDLTVPNFMKNKVFECGDNGHSSIAKIVIDIGDIK